METYNGHLGISKRIQSEHQYIYEMQDVENYGCFARNRHSKDYRKDLGLDLSKIIRRILYANDSFTWYDLCCGEFIVGKMIDEEMEAEFGNTHYGRLKMVGVDIWAPNSFGGSPCIDILETDVVDFELPEKIDLITCEFGLKWVEIYQGVKPELIKKWYNSLNFGGLIALYGFNSEHSFWLSDVDPSIVTDLSNDFTGHHGPIHIRKPFK